MRVAVVLPQHAAHLRVYAVRADDHIRNHAPLACVIERELNRMIMPVSILLLRIIVIISSSRIRVDPVELTAPSDRPGTQSRIQQRAERLPRQVKVPPPPSDLRRLLCARLLAARCRTMPAEQISPRI